MQVITTVLPSWNNVPAGSLQVKPTGCALASLPLAAAQTSPAARRELVPMARCALSHSGWHPLDKRCLFFSCATWHIMPSHSIAYKTKPGLSRPEAAWLILVLFWMFVHVLTWSKLLQRQASGSKSSVRKSKLPAPSQLPPVEEMKVSGMGSKAHRGICTLLETKDEGKVCLRVSREVQSWDLGKDVLPSTCAAFSNGFCWSGDKNMVCPLGSTTALMLHIPSQVLSDPSSSLLGQRQWQYPPGYPHISSDAGVPLCQGCRACVAIPWCPEGSGCGSCCNSWANCIFPGHLSLQQTRSIWRKLRLPFWMLCQFEKGGDPLFWKDKSCSWIKICAKFMLRILSPNKICMDWLRPVLDFWRRPNWWRPYA